MGSHNQNESNGIIEQYKARLVANGFYHQDGPNYNKTFSPVVKHTTIHLVLSLVVSTQWNVLQLDVQNAWVFFMQKSTWRNPKDLLILSFLRTSIS